MEDLQTLHKDEQEQDNNAQDKVNLRREARRRKILENAKKRMEKLNGGRGSGDAQVIRNEEEQQFQFSDPEVEPDIPERMQPAPAAFEYGQLFSSMNAEMAPERQQQRKRHVLLRARVHVLLAAALSYLVSMMANDENGFAIYSVFIPAGILIALEFAYFREQRQISPIANLIISLYGFRSQKANRIFHFFTTIQSLVVDMGIFVFFFCTITFVLASANDTFINLVVIK